MSFFKDYAGTMPDLGITFLQVTERLRIQRHPRTLNTQCDLLHLKQCFCASSNSENCQLLRAVRYMSVFTNGWCVWKLPSLQTEGWRASQQLHLRSCSPWLPLISGLLQGCTCSVHGFNQTLSTDSAKIKHGTQFFIRTGWLQILAFWRKRKREDNKKSC